MSHHDDNLYTILGKLAALQPKPEIKTSKEAAKKIYESVEARGSILSGVDAVQAKLAKQFAMERDESKLKKGHCSDCDCSPCKCEKCNECGMLESKCQCKQDITEGAMSEIHMELSQVAQDEDYDRLSELMSDSGLVGQYLQHQVEDITSETGLHPDDDFEEIENRLMDRIQSNFGDDDDVAEGGKTPKQYWNRDSQSIGSTPDDGLTYADPDEDGVHYPDYGNTKFQQQAKPKPTQATSANKRLTDKQYAKQLHKHYASLYDTLRITFNRRKNIFSVTGDNGFETDYHKYRVDPTTNKLKIMMSTSVENESVNPGVAEASYINGKEEDPKSLRWKQTSMTQQQAITKYGKENVRVTRGGLRNGDDMVEVKVPLGEQGVAEGLGTSQDRLLARTGMNNAHKFPRDGQTNLGNIPGMNTPDASPETKAYADQQRAKRPGDLKAAIRGQLGKHHKPNLPEQDVEEGETVVKGNVSTHKGTYGNEYQGDPDDDDGKPAPKAPKVSNSKTGKKGRPTKDAAPVYTNSNDPFGRSSLPKNKVKGKVHKMDEAMTQLELQLIESVTLDEGGVTFQHILATFKRDVKDFEENGELSDHLYDALYDYYRDDMPYGTQKLRDGDPHEWVADRFGADLGIDGYGGNSPGVPDEDYGLERESIDPTNPRDYEIPAYQRKAQGQAPLTARDIMQKDKKPEHDFYQRRTGEVHPDAMQRELNELAKLAGLSEDCGDMSPIGSAMQDMHDEQDNLSISTTYNSRDGKKTISVNADGEQAEALLQMLRIAGLGGGEAAQQAQSRVIAVAEPDQEIEVDEADAPVDDAGANPVNAPKPEYKTMRQSTMNPGEGDNGEKAMHPDRPTSNNGDNALARPANESISELEASLVAEYESIKKVN